ncbi:toll/interleukin-1 receptor domain-containing protein [Vulcanococcus limneticus]|uniref:toll/interleukin-1 receptor domain-containing protein n=1 Tax=Vulcanococcus limneticus TaxID=2170428 RepID=UPI00398C1B16
MSHQVFISHSSKNADIASAMKSYLEARGVKCWKAPEDIPYGMDWDVGIINGLSQCSVMVLIFSKEADDSGHVKKELVFADNQKKVIIPFKIDGYMPANLAYFLALPQWLDGIMDIEAAFGDLYNRLQVTLGMTPVPQIEVVESTPPQAPQTSQQPVTQPVAVPQADIADMNALLSILPEYQDWACNSDVRTRLRWDKDKLKTVVEYLEREGRVIYRDGSGGAIAIKSQELADLESRLQSGSDTYPYFVNVGEHNILLNDGSFKPESRSARYWEDCKNYGFISAGGGPRFAKQMQKLPVGAEVYLYISSFGYVGQARVTHNAVPIDKFLVNGTPVTTLPLEAPNALHDLGNHEMCEWLVRVDWTKALARTDAIKKIGLFVHVATSCRIKDSISIKYLREQFCKA